MHSTFYWNLECYTFKLSQIIKLGRNHKILTIFKPKWSFIHRYKFPLRVIIYLFSWKAKYFVLYYYMHYKLWSRKHDHFMKSFNFSLDWFVKNKTQLAFVTYTLPNYKIYEKKTNFNTRFNMFGTPHTLISPFKEIQRP